RMYEFELNVRGEAFRAEVFVNQTDTNEEALEKVAAAVNSLGAGVTAGVVRNTTAGTATLEIRGVPMEGITGATLRDTSGDLLENLGVSTGREAYGTQGGVSGYNDYAVLRIQSGLVLSDSNRVALFEKDGALRHVPSGFLKSAEELYEDYRDSLSRYEPVTYSSGRLQSDVTGGYRGEITVRGAGEATVSIVPDMDNVAEAVGGYVGDFNRLNAELKTQPMVNFKEIAGFLADAFTARRAELESAGIEKDREKYRVDRDTLRSNLKTSFDEIAALFGAPDGLASKTRFAAAKILLNPLTGLSPLMPSDLGSFRAPGMILDAVL
ncbi:MAG: hypothetical protein AB1742_07015, partial [bacterium]